LNALLAAPVPAGVLYWWESCRYLPKIFSKPYDQVFAPIADAPPQGETLRSASLTVQVLQVAQADRPAKEPGDFLPGYDRGEGFLQFGQIIGGARYFV